MIDNEQVLAEIQTTARENHHALKRIYNLEDFYENNLLPKLLSFPTQFINKIKSNRLAAMEKSEAESVSAPSKP